MLFSELIGLVRGQAAPPPVGDPAVGDPAVRHLLTDSRQLADPAGTVFFALRGPHHDGHRFLADLHRRGVRMFVVEIAQVVPLQDSHVVAVPDGVAALQAVAAAHRAQFVTPVIGITGSNGKTIVKEWLAQLLEPDYRVVKSPRSYNSQVGVPLSVWQMNDSHTLGIFEAGISQPGEMARLRPIIRPTLGIFTTLGPAHDEGFANHAQKAAEKLLLFDDCPQLICCLEYPKLNRAIQQWQRPSQRVFTWTQKARSGYASMRARRVPPRRSGQPNAYEITFAESPARDFTLTIPFTDAASVENVLHCVAALHLLGLGGAEIQRRVAQLRPVAMRLEVLAGTDNAVLINDAYNNDLTGLTIAVQFWQQQTQRPRKVLILSDLLESGLPAQALYARIAHLLRTGRVDALLGVGEALGRYASLFDGFGARFYPTTDALLTDPVLGTLGGSVVLVKGARTFGFERVVAALQQKSHGTTLEINLDALAHNFHFYRQKLGPQTKLMAMVKASAYGSGSAEVANLLHYHRADYLAVAYADEGVALRQAGVPLPIMVMNPAEDAFGTLRTHRLEPELYRLGLLAAWCRTLPAPVADHPPLGIHLKLDTGMHRLGFGAADLPALTALLRQHRTGLRVASVFTHLAAADEPEHQAFTIQQLTQFGQWADALTDALGYRPLRHALNSAGIARYPAFQMDMVRLGIGLYGVSPGADERAALRPVGTLKTTISQIKPLARGQTVGYGRRGVMPHDGRVATLAIGYADGYDRRFGLGVGQVLVGGVRCPVIGNVCMDMTMVDITAVPAAREGDPVILFGEDLPIAELARTIGTIPYELLTAVGERVKRVFFKE